MGPFQTTTSLARGLIISGLSLCLSIASANSSLLERSPFLPHSANRPAVTTAPPPSAQQNQLQFKGVFGLNDELRFNLFDARENRGSWVRLNESFAGATVVGFDESSRSVDIEVAGVVSRLSMLQGSDSPLPVATSSRLNNDLTGPRRPTITNASDGPRRAISRRRVVQPNRQAGTEQNTQTSRSQLQRTMTNTSAEQNAESTSNDSRIQHARRRPIRHESN